MFIVSAISTLFLAKEASWGGDRKIKETIKVGPLIDIVPSAGRSSNFFKHFKEKRRKKKRKMGISGIRRILRVLTVCSYVAVVVLVVSR